MIKKNLRPTHLQLSRRIYSTSKHHILFSFFLPSYTQRIYLFKQYRARIRNPFIHVRRVCVTEELFRLVMSHPSCRSSTSLNKLHLSLPLLPCVILSWRRNSPIFTHNSLQRERTLNPIKTRAKEEERRRQRQCCYHAVSLFCRISSRSTLTSHSFTSSTSLTHNSRRKYQYTQ
jgi:hypothetical protein